jgi:hypothetical protein
MNKFLITEEEKNRILNLHRLRSKNQYLIFESDEEVDVENFVPKTRAEVMALQQAILGVEKEERKIKDENGEPISPEYRTYGQGRSSLIAFSGSSLCNGFCNVQKAVDGIYGPRTKKTFDDYKNHEQFKTKLKTELKDVEEKYSPSVNDWRIPASKDAIKSFQYFIWKVIEYDLPEVDSSCVKPNCEFKSILCGENPCKIDKAVDGFWGPNTKKAWNEYKDKYLSRFSFSEKYDSVKDYIDKNYDGDDFKSLRKKYDKKPEDEKETDDNKEKKTDQL